MTTARTDRTVRRELGLQAVVALVMGNMIGSGVFLLPSSLAPFGGGLSLLGWVASAAGAIALALVFARLARVHPTAGGPYAFTRAAFGDFAGFLVAWSYWISIWATLSALAVAAVGYLDPFIPAIVRHPPSASILAVAVVWGAVLINSGGVGLAGRVQVVTTAIKVLPLAVIGVAGLAAFEPARFAVSSVGLADTGRGVMGVMTLTLWAFLGLESGTIPADAVKTPERTIPRATVVGTLLTAAFYIVSTVGVMSLIPPDMLATSTAPFADAARVIAGDWAASAVALAASVSCLGALNGWTLVAGRLPLATADDGLFPAVFRRLSGQHLPVPAMVIAGVLATTLVAMNSSRGLVELFTFIILLSTLGTLVPYLFCSLASLLLREPGGGPLSRVGMATAGFAFVYAMGRGRRRRRRCGLLGVPVADGRSPRLRLGCPRATGGAVVVTPAPPSVLDETSRMTEVVLKHARDAFVGQRAIEDEWCDLHFTAAPDFDRAIAEYDRFHEIVLAAGAQVRWLPARGGAGLDSIYVRDASVPCERGVVLCGMGKAQRAWEPAAQEAAFREWGVPVAGAIRPPGRLEGGDVVWLDEHTVAVGRGYRTNDEGIRQLRRLVGDAVELVTVAVPHWRGAGDVFHLMSIISPIDVDLAVVYSPLMAIPFRQLLLDRGIELIDVPDDEYESMGANVLALAPRRCVMVAGNPRTRGLIEAAGGEVLVYEASEISLKGGGGPTCLTRPIARTVGHP